MKNSIIVLLIVLPFISSAQSIRELWQQKDVGFGLSLYQFDGFTVEAPMDNATSEFFTDTTALSSSNSFGFRVFNGWNFPVLNLGEDFSVGVNPNIVLGVGLSGGIGLFFEAPVYITLKYGTDARWNNSTSFDKKFGFAFGFGVHGVAGYTEAPISTTGVGMAYVRPTFMAEVSFVRKQDRVNKIRFFMNIGNSKSRDYTEDVGYPARVAYSQLGVSFIRTMYGQ